MADARARTAEILKTDTNTLLDEWIGELRRGGAVAGRHTGNIFIENGRFHGAKIVDALAQRLGD